MSLAATLMEEVTDVTHIHDAIKAKNKKIESKSYYKRWCFLKNKGWRLEEMMPVMADSYGKHTRFFSHEDNRRKVQAWEDRLSLYREQRSDRE